MKNIFLKIIIVSLLFFWASPTQAADETLWCLTANNTCKSVTDFKQCESGDMQVKGKEICEGFLTTPLWCLNSEQQCVSKLDLCAVGINDLTYEKCKELIPQKPAEPKPENSNPPEPEKKSVGDNFPTKGNVVKLINPIGGTAENPQGEMNLPILLGKIIKNTLGILGTAALLVFVYAGFQWVTAAGNSDRISAGTDAMTWSAVGICIIFSSYAILQLVFETILGPQALTGTQAPQTVVGKACYCTVNGKSDVVLNSTFGFADEIACNTVKGKEVTTKSGDTIKNCTWK